MTRYKKGAKQIHINIRVTNTEFKVFKSMGKPKEVLLNIIYANMSDVQKCQYEIEKNNELVSNTQQDNVVLQNIIRTAQPNVVVP